MKPLNTLSLWEMKEGLESKKFTSVQIVRALKDAFYEDQKNPFPINAFVEFFDDALDWASVCDEKRTQGDTRPLLGLPIAVKDNILMKGRSCSCASHILGNFKAPYCSTVVSRLQEAGIILLGRTNMDEFGMGSSTEYTIFGPSRNPFDRKRVAGGSSGGSAVAVAAFQAPLALGSETGGSVRLPASFCGVYGLKPTYGLLSRYGLVAYASSLDQIGLFAKDARDIELVLPFIAGKDKNDLTTMEYEWGIMPFKPVKAKCKIAVLKEFTDERTDCEILEALRNQTKILEKLGHVVEEVSVQSIKNTISIYYAIAAAEAASNLARFDGVRYGARAKSPKNMKELYQKTREEGFGFEVQKRIFLGNYVLSSLTKANYYKRAQQARKVIKQDIEKIWEEYDLILAPSSAHPPFLLGEKIGDSYQLYLSDIFTTFVNLIGGSSLSIPAGFSKNGLPLGVQLIGPALAEKQILALAKQLKGIPYETN